MLNAFLFLLLWGGNFAWLVIVIGGLMAKVMSRTSKRNPIIICVVAVLSLLLTIWTVGRDDEFDDSIMTNCENVRDGCY